MDVDNLNIDTEENNIDVNNVEDISDVYEDIEKDNLSDEDTGSEAESSAPTGSESTVFDDSNIINSLSELESSIIVTNESLEHISHRFDQTYDLVICITILLSAFVAISVFRKLFDWLA